MEKRARKISKRKQLAPMVAMAIERELIIFELGLLQN
jgi:hypothetical protein